MNCAILINLSLKYQNSTPSGCKKIGIQKFEVVAKTQFLYIYYTYLMFFCSRPGVLLLLKSMESGFFKNKHFNKNFFNFQV